MNHVFTGTPCLYQTQLRIETKDKAFNFSLEVLNSTRNVYYNRRPNSIQKIVNDHFYAKLAEAGVWNFFHSKSVLCSVPDFEVYESKRKSFSADLSVTGKTIWNVHVKCQPLASQINYGLAWLFQPNDDVTFCPRRDDLVILTSIDSHEKILVHKIVRAIELTPYYDLTVKGKKRITLDAIKHLKSHHDF